MFPLEQTRETINKKKIDGNNIEGIICKKQTAQQVNINIKYTNQLFICIFFKLKI